MPRSATNSRAARVLLVLFITTLCALQFVFSHAASSQEAARRALLADEFFDEFYGVESVDLVEFTAQNESLVLNFASDPKTPRASFDAPFRVDCTEFSSYELIAEVDDVKAIGYVSLYFHSKSGWYNATGDVKRVAKGRVSIVFSATGFVTEENPAGLDAVDAIRISFWRGDSVDAKMKLRSFKGARRSFAILDVDNGNAENDTFRRTFARIVDHGGLPCDVVKASQATPELLERYSAVFLPIANGISAQAVDALCAYVDGGGFVFTFYNAPTKLLKKIGVNVDGFVRCSDAGLDVAGMTLTSEARAGASQRGFELPETIGQASWNFEVVSADPNYRSVKRSLVWGDNRARVVANWSLTNGETTKYPALVASGSGVYCSHVFTDSSMNDKRAFLRAITIAARPQLARSFLRADWLSIFNVGVAPDADLVEMRAQTLDFIEKELKDSGRSLTDALRVMSIDSTAALDEDAFLEIKRFQSTVAEIKEKRVHDFLASQPSRSKEGRFWWEHSGCGIYPGNWERTMKELSDAGFNAVIPNLLWGGLAYYQSEVLPVAPFVEKLGDQVEAAVAAGKKYGVEVHAWMVCFNASNSPKWFLDKMREEGRLQTSITGEENPWLCPSNPENQALELAALEEVATKYDVDGIHFDYIRFPDSQTCYCQGCRERFAAACREKGIEIGDFPNSLKSNKALNDAWHSWRCDQITTFVRDVNKAVRAKRPDIQISAAVFPRYPGTKESIGQDWGLWVDEGLLDFVCPMDYTSDPAYFAQLVESQLPYVKGKCPIYPGIGMTATGIAMTPEEVVMQASIARKLGADGFTIFNLAQSTAAVALPAFKEGATSEKTERR